MSRTAILLAVVLLLVAGVAGAAVVQPAIVQSRGADPTVDYAAFARFSPWDDRNYTLTRADVALLSPTEHELRDPIPVFYRVALRRANPKLRQEGVGQYPRSAVNAFRMHYRGYLYDGRIFTRITLLEDGSFAFRDAGLPVAEAYAPDALDGEVRISSPIGAAESAVAINPVNRDLVIAGTNGTDADFRQIMWRSTDGGETWSLAGNLPGPETCCDPTVDWSIDGTIAYTASLTTCGFSGCGVHAYRSTDNGATWVTPVQLVASGADKEYMHVDRVAASPHSDNIYLAWHEGNVQKFARSTDLGLTYSPVLTLDSTRRGIGSDLTSDTNGNVYYFYPTIDSANPAQVRVLKSSDGGATFAPAVVVAPLNDRFDFAIPAMDVRRAFIYVSADTDLSGGPFANRIYATWTDTTAAESGTPANNHARIVVARSADGGATWNTTLAHESDDLDTVDRFHPWLKVDEVGRVHVIYYDTRVNTDRTGVDLFYSRSDDGGVTFTAPTRLSTVKSPKIDDNFEWGDYNGLDIVLDNAIAIYTDNRDELGGTARSVDTYGIGGFAPPAGDSYLLSLDQGSTAVCAGDPSPQRTVTLARFGNYANPVTLSLPGLDGAVFPTSAFGTNPVTPPGTSTFDLATAAGAPAATYNVVVRGTGAGAAMGDPPIVRDATYAVRIDNLLAAAPNLLTPNDGAGGVQPRPTLSWGAVPGAASYVVQVSTTADFGSIVDTGNVDAPTTSYTTAASLAPNTQHWWRVRATNGCGDSPLSAVRSFTTANLVCSSAPLLIPDSPAAGVSQPLAVSAPGAVSNLKVTLRGTHTWVGDLLIRLSKDGVANPVRLIDRPGRPDAGTTGTGCSANDFNTTLDDTAATAAEDQCSATPPAIGGPQRPNDPLAGFNGAAIAGTWTLFVQDLAGSDIGQVTEWCLQLPSGGGPQPVIPGVPDLAAASDSGRSSTDNLTNAASPVFTGTCQNGDSIQLREGATDVGTPALCSGGSYSLSAAGLSDGVHNIAARASIGPDSSAPSAALAVTIDRAAPAAPAITGPTTPQSPAVVVAGTGGENNAELRVQEGATQVCSSILPAAGNWTCNATLPGAGLHVLTAFQSDAAGNASGNSASFDVTVADALFANGFE